jgi:hypothetical protein
MAILSWLRRQMHVPRQRNVAFLNRSLVSETVVVCPFLWIEIFRSPVQIVSKAPRSHDSVNRQIASLDGRNESLDVRPLETRIFVLRLLWFLAQFSGNCCRPAAAVMRKREGALRERHVGHANYAMWRTPALWLSLRWPINCTLPNNKYFLPSHN